MSKPKTSSSQDSLRYTARTTEYVSKIDYQAQRFKLIPGIFLQNACKYEHLFTTYMYKHL
jgi:hypothetical protein